MFFDFCVPGKIAPICSPKSKSARSRPGTPRGGWRVLVPRTFFGIRGSRDYYIGSTPPPTKSHHQDSCILCKGSLYKPSFFTVTGWVGGLDPNHIRILDVLAISTRSHRYTHIAVAINNMALGV